MGLAESLPRVVLDVLVHLLVRIETDLVQASLLSLCIGKVKKGSPDAIALYFGQDCNVVYVEVILPWPQHDEPHEPVIEGGNVHGLPIYQARVIIEHGCWWFAHSLDIRGVGRVDAGAHAVLIYSHCPTDFDSRGASHPIDITAEPTEAVGWSQLNWPYTLGSP